MRFGSCHYQCFEQDERLEREEGDDHSQSYRGVAADPLQLRHPATFDRALTNPYREVRDRIHGLGLCTGGFLGGYAWKPF